MFYFIVNKHGGSGKAIRTWQKVQKLLAEQNIQYKAFDTEYKGHGAVLAANISSLQEADKKIVVVGGDGSINEVLNGIADFDSVQFAVIPTGSGNDFARGMGIPKNTRKAFFQIVKSKAERKIDLGRVTTPDFPQGKFFGISSGIGMDAIVCKRALTSKLKTFLNKIHLGNLIYILLTVHTLFSMETINAQLTLTDFDGTKRELHFGRLIFLACMNCFAEGGGVPMCPDAKVDDGLFSTCVADSIPKWKTFLDLPFLVSAKHAKLKGFSLSTCKELDIKTDKAVVLHTDGEYVGDVSTIHFECLKGKLRLIQ